jgi:hypothetical protein
MDIHQFRFQEKADRPSMIPLSGSELHTGARYTRNTPSRVARSSTSASTAIRFQKRKRSTQQFEGGGINPVTENAESCAPIGVVPVVWGNVLIRARISTLAEASPNVGQGKLLRLNFNRLG